MTAASRIPGTIRVHGEWIVAIWDRLYAARSTPICPRNSRGSHEPTNAMAPASGGENTTAAPRRTGKLTDSWRPDHAGTGIRSITATDSAKNQTPGVIALGSRAIWNARNPSVGN